MCGIIGYTGHRPAINVVLDGLRRLEYRGYDSAGLALIQNKQLQTIRTQGKLNALEDRLNGNELYNATTAIGHTRWATHGLPIEKNAHPHMDNARQLALVHNGIIENFQELKNELQSAGFVFNSDTDTEVLAHLISQGLQSGLDIPQALQNALHKVKGSYALAVITMNHQEQIWAARCSSPLILGVGTGENFLASDIPAFLPYTREVVFLEDNELVLIQPNQWQVYNLKLEKIRKDTEHISWDIQAAQKSGYKHFMLKEIMEQPQVIRDCLSGRLVPQKNEIILEEIQDLPIPNRLFIVACGTSFHAGLWAKYILEKWSNIPVEVDIASEFRYRNPTLHKGDLVLTISQSGETADSIACLAVARQMGIPVLGLCNVLGSTIARESEAVIYTQAGPEISVASTKAMCSQMTALILLSLYWAKEKNILDEEFYAKIINGLAELPHILQAELSGMQIRAREIISKYSQARSFFFLGRGLCFPLALEGALKLKEISYIHAEGYAAGEMKHGPIALIDKNFPTFALAPKDELISKLLGNLKEVQARGGPLIVLTNPGIDLQVDEKWEIPEMWGPLNSFMILPALQLFAYEMAVYLGKDVDQPRNLAKSVTVE